MEISGNIIDPLTKREYPATLVVEDGRIKEIRECGSFNDYITPGFVDSHIHIESSMLVPSEFARIAVNHGTVATVSDPHEIGNVLGVPGVKFMIENGKKVNFKFNFGAPSCVPTTAFETAGASIGPNEIKQLLASDDIKYLSEMMNFPGVLNGDKDVEQKIAFAKSTGKPIDGHAPGLSGDGLKKYVSSGISTDHETFDLSNAIEKIKLGMKILIREGSAAKNFNELASLIELYPDKVMFCSDDKHPDSLMEGHINLLVKRSLQLGFDRMKILQIACVNPVKHYSLNVGLLQVGDPADFLVLDKDFNVKKTFINGELVSENGKSKMPRVDVDEINNFNTSKKKVEDFQIKFEGKVKVIQVIENQLITKKVIGEPREENGLAISNPEQDILKIAVVNRYSNEKPAIGFVKGFGIRGAIASSVAHDSHNIIAVGDSDEAICNAVNNVIENKGGLSSTSVLPLPVAGLMSSSDYEEVAEKYANLQIDSKLKDPFMTLSFMALLVIPELKLSDKGLFDGNEFKFTKLSS